jgi:hypothetical protein
MGCRCHCHNWLRGTQRAAYDAENYMTAFQYSQRARVWEDIMENVSIPPTRSKPRWRARSASTRTRPL